MHVDAIGDPAQAGGAVRPGTAHPVVAYRDLEPPVGPGETHDSSRAAECFTALVSASATTR